MHAPLVLKSSTHCRESSLYGLWLPMRVLIVGGSGYLGQFLVEALAQAGS